MVHFGEFLKTWSLLSNSVTRQVSFHRTKIGGKCQNSKSSNSTFWVIFKQCGALFEWFSNTVQNSPDKHYKARYLPNTMKYIQYAHTNLCILVELESEEESWAAAEKRSGVIRGAERAEHRDVDMCCLCRREKECEDCTLALASSSVFLDRTSGGHQKAPSKVGWLLPWPWPSSPRSRFFDICS